MILVRTPLRLEFLGGGTDIQYFYSREKGYVLNASIDKYIYVAVNRHNETDVRVGSSEGHNRISATLSEFDIQEGVEIISLSDITARGSGLGSSSSFTVALVHALSLLKEKDLSPVDIAEMACRIEIDILGEPIGKQDQYAAALGGMAVLTFNHDGRVDVQSVHLPEEIQQALRSHLLLFSTGLTRSATDILKDQTGSIEKNIIHLKRMADVVLPGVNALVNGNLKEFAEILETEWSIKKNLSHGVSNTEIETMYHRAKNAGAWGGRVSGAGGGGFMMLIAPPHTHEHIRKTLIRHIELPTNFTTHGSEVLFQEYS